MRTDGINFANLNESFVLEKLPKHPSQKLNNHNVVHNLLKERSYRTCED